MTEKKSEFRDEAERERLEAEAAQKTLIALKLQARGGRPGCDTCMAFDEVKLECHRKAPVVQVVPQFKPPTPMTPPGQPGELVGFKTMGLYPATEPLSWCREYQAWPPDPTKKSGSPILAKAQTQPMPDEGPKLPETSGVIVKP